MYSVHVLVRCGLWGWYWVDDAPLFSMCPDRVGFVLNKITILLWLRSSSIECIGRSRWLPMHVFDSHANGLGRQSMVAVERYAVYLAQSTATSYYRRMSIKFLKWFAHTYVFTFQSKTMRLNIDEPMRRQSGREMTQRKTNIIMWDNPRQ